MNKQQALEILYNCARMARLTDDENAQMKQAAQVLAQAITPQDPKKKK